MNKDKVAIIIVNYNQYKFTLDCIESIRNSNYLYYKIFLIDNSTEKNDKLSILHNLDKVELLLPDKNIGYVGGVNFGLKKCLHYEPDYVLIMNNDTIIHGESINKLVSKCKEYNNKAIVTGKVFHFDDKKRLQEVGSIFSNKALLMFKKLGLNELDKGQFEEVAERDMIDDIFWLFHLDLYKKIGFYSDYFWFNSEQADFALRAKKAGYKLIYNPSAIIWHKGSASIGGLEKNPKQAYWSIQSSLILRYLHLNKVYFLCYYILTLQSIVRTLLKAILLKVFSKNDIMLYAKSKFYGLVYFNHWIFNKLPNTGKNPFNS